MQREKKKTKEEGGRKALRLTRRRYKVPLDADKKEFNPTKILA